MARPADAGGDKMYAMSGGRMPVHKEYRTLLTQGGLLGGLVVLGPSEASVQGSLIEALVKGASDVNVSAGLDRLPASSESIAQGKGARGISFEIAYDFLTTDTTRKRAANAPRIEIGVGYSQSVPFFGRDTGEQFRFAVRGLPELSVYVGPAAGATFPGSRVEITPYAGLRTGIVSVHAGRAYTDSVVYSATAQTFQLGAAGVCR